MFFMAKWYLIIFELIKSELGHDIEIWVEPNNLAFWDFDKSFNIISDRALWTQFDVVFIRP